MTPEQEIEFWDWVAGSSTRIDQNVYSDLNLDDCLAEIVPHIDLTGWVLELGCGPGRLTRTLAAEYPQVRLVGVDSSPLMIRLAEQLDPSIVWITNNGRDLADLAGNMFDSAYTMTTFQHIPPEAQQGYLAELRRVVRPGGKLRLQFVVEGEPGPLNYPTTVKDMLRMADRAGWRDVEVMLGRVRAEWAWLTLQAL